MILTFTPKSQQHGRGQVQCRIKPKTHRRENSCRVVKPAEARLRPENINGPAGESRGPLPHPPGSSCWERGWGVCVVPGLVPTEMQRGGPHENKAAALAGSELRGWRL